MVKVQVVVPGRPVPKQRPRPGPRGFFIPAATMEYQHLVGIVTRNKMRQGPILEGDVELRISLYFKRSGRATGDIDNYAKSILDGLNQVAYLDDSQVIRLGLEMFYVLHAKDERAEIVIMDQAAAEQEPGRAEVRLQAVEDTLEWLQDRALLLNDTDAAGRAAEALLVVQGGRPA